MTRNDRSPFIANAARRRLARLALALPLLAAVCVPAQAAIVAGRVQQLTGAMTAAQPGGQPRALAPHAEVLAGDTLVTGAGAYALVRFLDQSEIAFKPATTLKVDDFRFDHALPDNDSAAYTLVKGGMRAVSGLLGQRNKERFVLKTPSATIGIRGTTFFLEYLTGEEAPGGAASPLRPGLHVYVGEGGLTLVNKAGVFKYDPGQWGWFKDDASAPVKTFGANPGMRFDLPPGFGPAGLPPAP